MGMNVMKDEMMIDEIMENGMMEKDMMEYEMMENDMMEDSMMEKDMMENDMMEKEMMENDHMEKECMHQSWIGDGICDDEANTEVCNFDGGDCCGSDADFSFCEQCICYNEDSYDSGMLQQKLDMWLFGNK